jgi:SAM-dependent methyltransferase
MDYSAEIDKVFEDNPVKLVLSKTTGSQVKYRRITITRKNDGYQMEMLTDKQAFHQNYGFGELELLKQRCAELLSSDYRQLNAFGDGGETALMVSRKGKCSLVRSRKTGFRPEKISAGHNRRKEYIFNEGDIIPPMVDMGIMTREGKIVASRYDKFKQINRFVQIIDDVVKNRKDEHLNIIDFGCGKSYLTFILYYYFTEVKHLDVNVTGLDLKEDVINNCSEAARRYHYDNLHFEVGDINGYTADAPVDMVITLHACDTATDYALFNAIRWNAGMIFSVPCCQHEVNGQIESRELSALTKYGIVKERTAALMTDAVRGSLLEACGYDTQLLEFVDFAHTPKNILIRGEYTGRCRKESLAEVERLMDAFSINPTLYRLLLEDGRLG